MPLAFDFTSTLVIGSILPVATTLLAMSPCSTVASLLGSILPPPLLAITKPKPPNTSMRTIMPPQISRFLVLFLPFATTPPAGSARHLSSSYTPLDVQGFQLFQGLWLEGNARATRPLREFLDWSFEER